MLAYIDHVTLAVRNVDAAGTALRERLSLIVTAPRGDDQSGLSHAAVPLTRGYLELVSPEEPAAKSSPAVRRLDTFLDSGEGLFSFALNTADLSRDVATLRERGSTLGSPERDEKGEGSESVWWSSFPAELDLEPYLVQHSQRSAVALSMVGGRQPLAIRSIEEVVIVVPELDPIVQAYERDFGLTINRRIGRQAQIPAGTSRIMLVPAAAAPLGTPIGIYSVSLGTTDIKGAQATLRQRGVETTPALFSWGVAVQIDPGVTFDARINLVQL